MSCSVGFRRFCAKNVLVWMLFDLVKAVLYLSISRPIILNISSLHLKSKNNVQILVFILCDYLFSDFSNFLLLQIPFHCFQIFFNLFLSRLRYKKEKSNLKILSDCLVWFKVLISFCNEKYVWTQEIKF